MLLNAREDLTAFADFPPRHWKKIQSTNPLERINREIKRRTDVLQVFPDDDALGIASRSPGRAGAQWGVGALRHVWARMRTL